MPILLDIDICVIGGGAAGLAVAAGASQMGAMTVLVERGALGGECLNTGCVPTKAFLAAAAAAQAVREAGRFGVMADAPWMDAKGIYGHVRRTIAALAPVDSKVRFEGLGVTVIGASGRFLNDHEVTAGDYRVRARRFVIATGTSPMVPEIPGLEGVPFLTNDTLLAGETLPDHLIVLGGGPVGMEMAQAHRRLGCRATILERETLLRDEDPELVDVVRRRFRAEEIAIHEQSVVERIETASPGISVAFRQGSGERRVSGTHLLIAAGRVPNVAGLGLEEAGIAFTAHGITVDSRLRTSNRRVFAIGDVAGGPRFTHVATHQAGVVLKNALLRIPARVEGRAVPRALYTSPELATVGWREREATAGHRAIRILRWPFFDNDRARAEGDTEGLVKIVTTRRGRILGAGIVGAGAAELIQPWVLALKQRLNIAAMADLIVPYPTRGEAGKRAAMSFFAPIFSSETAKRIVRFLARFG